MTEDDKIINMMNFAADRSTSRKASEEAILTYGTTIDKMIVTSTKAFVTAFADSMTILVLEDRKDDLKESGLVPLVLDVPLDRFQCGSFF